MSEVPDKEIHTSTWLSEVRKYQKKEAINVNSLLLPARGYQNHSEKLLDVAK